MIKQRLTIPEQPETTIEAEILAREVEEIIRRHSSVAIRIALDEVSQLPHLGVEGDELVTKHPQRQRILQRIARAGIESPSLQ